MTWPQINVIIIQNNARQFKKRYELTQAWLSNSLRKFSYIPPLPPSPLRPSPPPALLLPLSLPLKMLLSVAEYTEKEVDMALQRRDTSSPSPSISVVTPSMPLSPYSLPSPKTAEMSCKSQQNVGWCYRKREHRFGFVLLFFPPHIFTFFKWIDLFDDNVIFF